jgi:hypothetical protein
MADSSIIPPVSGNRPVPKSRRPVPANQDKQQRQQQRRKPEKETEQKDDGRPSIDEYA